MKAFKVVAGLVIVGLAVTMLKKESKKRSKKKFKRLNAIAEEGYETAHDILFPGKGKERSKLTYGPVLPL